MRNLHSVKYGRINKTAIRDIGKVDQTVKTSIDRNQLTSKIVILNSKTKYVISLQAFFGKFYFHDVNVKMN